MSDLLDEERTILTNTEQEKPSQSYNDDFGRFTHGSLLREKLKQEALLKTQKDEEQVQ